MTRGDLKTLLTWEGKIAGNTDAISNLNGIISESIIFVGQSHPELLIIENVTYLISSQNPSPIVQALGVERVELSGAFGINESCSIPEEGKVVGPAPLPGWPKAYVVEGNAATSSAAAKGLKVRLVGGGSLDVGVDGFTVTWKMIPTLTDDTHVIPDAWVPFLKKECLARLGMYRSKGEGENAKGYTIGAGQALQAHVGTDARSTAETN